MPTPDRCSEDIDWSEFRRQMPVTRQWAFLDHAAVSPLPEPTQAAVTEWAHEAAVQGNTAWPSWSGKYEEVRRQFADLIGATTEEIALIHSTTEGINLVAEGFPWRPGDNVVTLADEFPSNQYPWLNQASRGVETRRVPVVEGRADPNRVAEACDARTRIVSVSWVSYSSGWRNDLQRLAEIAHGRGALLFVDAIQGLGAIPLDVRATPIDFLAADGHKWMMGPEGAGVFFTRHEHLGLLRPIGVGWHSVRHAHDFNRIELDLKDAAARYEGGSQNMVGVLGLRASLKLLATFGSRAIFERILHITDGACEHLQHAGARILSDRSPEHKSGIVVFQPGDEDPKAARQRLLTEGVVLSCRGGGLRISPHAYNDESDVERLVRALAKP